MSNNIKKIGVLTAGGDCPGLNPVIRSVVRTAIMKYGLEVVGFNHGYKGLYNNDVIPLTLDSVSGILPIGGTMLYSSNKDNLFDYTVEENGVMVQKDVSDVGVENMKKNGIDAIVIIGGDGSLTSGRDFARKGVKVVGVPKTIDNDLGCTDYTFGFDTAVGVACDAADRLHSTATSHSRIMVLEVMGRYAGWIALAAGIAGGADAILIPEIPYDIEKVAASLKERMNRGKNFAVVVVAEGAKSVSGELHVSKVIEGSPDPIRLGGIGSKIADELESILGLEARATILGHIQRGGTPTSHDRILSTRYGAKAVELLMEGKHGVMVTLNGDEMSYASLEDVIGQNKAVDPEGELVSVAKGIGITFGD